MKVEALQLLLLAATPLSAVPLTTFPSSAIKGRDITDQYIVQLDPSISQDSLLSHLNRRDQSVENVFQFGIFKAYAGTFDETTIAEISALKDVLSVEPNRVITIDEIPAIASPIRRDLITDANVAWHLGDVSHTEPGSTDYVYDSSAGTDQTAYVLDTGIRLSHDEFEGRAVFGYNAVTDSTTQNGTNSDTDGHGTHVAGIIAGKTYGVARKAKVVDVKVISDGAVSEVFVLDESELMLIRKIGDFSLGRGRL